MILFLILDSPSVPPAPLSGCFRAASRLLCHGFQASQVKSRSLCCIPSGEWRQSWMTEFNRLECWQQARGTQFLWGSCSVYYPLKASPEIVGALGRTLRAEEMDLWKELFNIFAGQGECGRSWEGQFARRYERNAAAPVQIVCSSAGYPMGQFQRHWRHLGTQVPVKVIDLKNLPLCVQCMKKYIWRVVMTWMLYPCVSVENGLKGNSWL